jgi:hypothetical protein
MELNILPDQTGKLPSQPDTERMVGAELEFHPTVHTLFEWRELLYDKGIDTFDDGARDQYGNGPFPRRENVRDACGLTLPNPQRLRDVPENETEYSRGQYIQTLFLGRDLNGGGAQGAETRQAFFDQFPSNIRPAGNIWGDEFCRAVAAKFPRPEEMARRRWNLGTDPTAGLELRTPPLTIGEGLFDALLDAGAALEENDAEANRNCGGHIHIDMRDKIGTERARLAATYIMCEPLICAVCNPCRYQRSYNRPLWDATYTMATIMNQAGAMNQFTQHASLLNFSALGEHGTLEWRQFEGVTDTKQLKYWILLCLRFTEASKNKWGIKMGRLHPIKATDDSMKDFLKFLDVDRNDVATDLKEMKDWYLERANEFKDRDAFSRRLVTAPNLADLRRLKETGTIRDGAPRIAFAEDYRPEQSASVVGQRFLRFVTDVVGVAALRPTTVAQPELPNVIAALGNEIVQNYVRETLGYEYPEEDFQWTLFAEAVARFDTEAVGQWLLDHVYVGNASEAGRAQLMAAVIRYWTQGWAFNSVGSATITNLMNVQTTEIAQCVGF